MKTFAKDEISALCLWPILVFLVWVGLVAKGETANPKQSLFATHCASCHGSDGRALTPVARKLGIIDLAESRLSDLELRKQILEGRLDTNSRPKMPAFSDKLNREQVYYLIEEVKAFRKK